MSKGLDLIALNVTDQQLEQLRYERFHHPHPRVQKKIEVIFLRARTSVGETCRIAGISANTYRAYLWDSPAGGVDGLTRFAEVCNWGQTWDSGFSRSFVSMARRLEIAAILAAGIVRMKSRVAILDSEIADDLRSLPAAYLELSPESVLSMTYVVNDQ